MMRTAFAVALVAALFGYGPANAQAQTGPKTWAQQVLASPLITPSSSDTCAWVHNGLMAHSPFSSCGSGGGGGGGVSSVGTAAPLSGGPITSTGTISLTGPSNLTTFPAGTIPMGALTSPFVSSELTDVSSAGVVVGSATGGQKGAGTINMTGCFVNGTTCAGALPTLTNGQVLGNATGGTSTAVATNLVAGSGATVVASGGTITIGASGSGGVSGPGSSVNNDLACWNGTAGNALSDCGILSTNVVQTSRTISTTAPLTGGGNLTSNLSLAITIPTANLLGGSAGNFTSVAIPNAGLIGGSAGSFTSVTPGTCLSLSSGTLNGICTGSVTSVGLALPAGVFSISGSPVTTTGTLTGAFINQATNSVFAGPGSGPSAAPGFRALIAADLPGSGVTPGAYTSANISVNAQGQVTAATNGSASTPVIFAGPTAGTANAQTIATPTPTGFTLTDQLTVSAKIGAGLNNTGPATLAVNGTTAEPIEVQSSGGLGTLVGGELVAGSQVQFVFQAACSCYIMTTVVGSPIVNNATSTTVTQAQWSHGAQFNVTTAGQTFTLPVATSLGAGGGIVVNAIGVSTTIMPNAADGINGGSVGSAVTVCANNQASVFGVGSSGTGAFTANPLCAGGTTTVTLGGGLTSSPTTYNAGTQTITNLSMLSPQLFYVAEGADCTINSTCKSGSTDDSGLLPTMTAGGTIVTLPSPGAVGTKTYNIGYDGTHSYSITTPTGIIYGCGSGSGLTVTGVSARVQVVSDGTNWQCNQWGTLTGLANGTIPIAVTASSVGNSAISDTGNGVQISDPLVNWGTYTETMTISTSTFTPDMALGINHQATLIHASCPCTIANPANISLHAGQYGMFDIIQSSTGSDTVTWGSEYITPGGTSTLTLSTGASEIDHIAYRVIDSTHVLLGPVQANATH